MELRKISKNSIDSALDKARHYRLLNDPGNAESICRDVLDVEPENQAAITCLILALTDQFVTRSSLINETKEWIKKLSSPYDQHYLLGLIFERAAMQILAAHRPGCQHDAYDCLREAMQNFDQAERLATDAKNDDPILRWNSCIRLIRKHQLTPRAEESFRPYGD